jgi:tetratricopeptide (TPR) repeat protein
VFGVQFPAAGVAALVAGGAGDGATATLAALEAAERERLVLRRSDVEPAWSFANALVQQAAYAALAPEEKRAAHLAAARWLEARAGVDPSLLAWHFERAEESRTALGWYTAAARAALDGRDLDRARALADRALACAPAGPALARVLLVHAETAFFRNDARAGKRAAEEAMAAAAPGSLEWLDAAGLLVTAAGQVGDNAELVSHAERVRAQAPSSEPGAAGLRAVCLLRAASQLYAVGRHDEARALVDEVDRAAPADPLARAWRERLRAGFALIEDRYELGVEAYGEAVRLHAAAGDVRGACMARILKASFHVFLSDFEGAETELGVAEPMAKRTGADYLARWARYARGKVLALGAAPAAARAHLERVRAELAGSPRIVAGTHVYLGLAALRARDWAWAEAEARAGAEAHAAPSTRAVALAVLARALAGAGRASEAMTAAEEAAGILRSVGRVEENESVVHLAWAEALHASGRTAEARSAIDAAALRLTRIASGLSSAARRESFLGRIESHARTMRLAEELRAR